MLMPGPNQKIGQRQNPANPCRSQRHRNRLISNQERGTVAPLPDKHTLGRSSPQRFRIRRKRFEYFFKCMELCFASLLPTDPIPLQPFANTLTVHIQTVPNILRVKMISRRAIRVFAPVVTGRIPYRKSAINPNVNNDSGDGGAIGRNWPRLVIAPEN